ncbi:hypothetical protein SK128_019778 [Halocaridina rubra]|uniref:SUN domain-containing protein n=1 Tax=Halocaridina rubra TaxID=373956 RepID=A0AAN8WH87_HALRR
MGVAMGQQPKSDYTYSTSLTYRKRVTPDRKIGSPNMSRRTLKGENINYVGSPDFSVSESSSEDANSLNLRSRIIHKIMDGSSASGDTEESVEAYQSWNRRSSRSPSFDITRTNGSLTRTVTTTTTSYITSRSLHSGLDAESDVDDGTESTVPSRATPITARSGTPISRSMTPLGVINSRRSLSSSRKTAGGLDYGKAYKLGEGTIAEDLEEEEVSRNSVVVWSRKTWYTITRITTIITASIAMMAARAVSASHKESDVMLEKKVSRYSSFKSSVSTIKNRVVTTLSNNYTRVCDYLRKNPLWIWIPLLFILLLLALIAHWLLLQSRGKSAGANDPTEIGGSSFFSPLLLSASDLASSVYSGVSSVVVAAWVSTADACMWVAAALYGGLLYAWSSTLAFFTWLGSLAISCLSFLLQLFYTSWEYLQSSTMAVLGVFSSSASNLYAFLFLSSNETVSEDTSTSNDADKVNPWSIVAWAAKLSPLEFISESYVMISEGVQSSGTMLWNGWLWLVLSMGELLSALAGHALGLLSMTWSALVYLVTGLWTLLTYIFLALLGILTTAASTVSSVAYNTSSYIASSSRMIIAPFYATRDEINIPPSVVDSKPPEMKRVETLIQETVSFKDGSVEEIVRKVLESEELKVLIAAAVADSNKERLTVDTVSGIAKTVVERELAVLRSEIEITAAASSQQQNARLEEEKTLLILELEKLGQRLYNAEGKIEVSDRRSIEDRQQNEEQIEQLLQKIQNLQEDHTNLAMSVKNCCEEKNIPAVLGEIFGLSNATGDGKAAADIGSWLRSYFVAKEELEKRLNLMMATMETKIANGSGEKGEAAVASTLAAVEQTKQMVMETILEKLRLEMKQQQDTLTEETQKEMSEQINMQVKAAAGILGEQVLEQVQLQVQTQKQQLSETVQASVDAAVQDAVTSVLPNAVDSAVNVAVEKAVFASVDVAVEGAVNTAVSSAVREAVPNAVKNAVPDVVAEVLPNAVAEQVATAVPEAIASVLPSAVSSAVNETVSSAVSEAVVQINHNIEKKEITGIVGTASVNNSHADGNVYIAGMHNSGGLNESAVIEIVKNALKTYDADKTGMVDHALESAGGIIVSTRCTESYQSQKAEIIVLGFTIYRYSTNNPRSIIQPDTMPGQCWAFKGSQGYIVIQLAGPVRPTGFTMEHIPKSLSPVGVIDSAPRIFEVWGLNSENDEGVSLGVYEYREDGDPWQYFPVNVNNTVYFPYVELKINSNHGNLHYTCLYRFRVHGVRLN